jgi:hypothetical protein
VSGYGYNASVQTGHRAAFLVCMVTAGAACDRSPTAASPVAEGPSVSASTTASAPIADVVPSTPPAASSPPPAPLPIGSTSPVTPVSHVHVENIGMHIGGGPNDALNKAPIGDSVSPHFEEIRACWAKVSDGTRGGDFGVDLLIPAQGGRAKVTNPRTAIHPDAFRDCVVGVFEGVDFKKPLKGATMVSYSLRFTP